MANLKLAAFNGSPRRVVAETDAEREWLALLRCLTPEKGLELVALIRQVFQEARPEPATRMYMTIDRLHSGRSRTFWSGVLRTYTDFEGQSFDSVDEVIRTAEDVLDAFMTERSLASEGEPIIEADAPKIGDWVDCYVRRGRYRIEVKQITEVDDAGMAQNCEDRSRRR